MVKIVLVSSVLAYLRTRWRRLAACGAAIVAAVYLHGEYLAYMAIATPEATVSAGGGVLLAFVLKNAVIFVALIVAVLPEVRNGLRRVSRRGAIRTSDAKSAPRKPHRGERGATEPSGEDAVEDAFDFLRHRRKLSTPADRIIGSKPSR